MPMMMPFRAQLIVALLATIAVCPALGQDPYPPQAGQAPSQYTQPGQQQYAPPQYVQQAQPAAQSGRYPLPQPPSAPAAQPTQPPALPFVQPANNLVSATPAPQGELFKP